MRSLRRIWSEQEDAELLSLAAARTSFIRMGTRLRRSTTAVRSRLALLRARNRARGTHTSPAAERGERPDVGLGEQ